VPQFKVDEESNARIAKPAPAPTPSPLQVATQAANKSKKKPSGGQE